MKQTSLISIGELLKNGRILHKKIINLKLVFKPETSIEMRQNILNELPIINHTIEKNGDCFLLCSETNLVKFATTFAQYIRRIEYIEYKPLTFTTIYCQKDGKIKVDLGGNNE